VYVYVGTVLYWTVGRQDPKVTHDLPLPLVFANSSHFISSIHPPPSSPILSLHTVLYVMLLSSKATVATTASRISCRCPPRVLRCFSSDDRRVETKVDALGVCYVTLNRPDKLNAVDLAMFEAVAEAASNVRKDRNIRAVILSGTGPAFCTGLDVVRKARCYYIILSYNIYT
jgi:hypothetical protein